MFENSPGFTFRPSLIERILSDENFSTFAKLLRTSGAGEIFAGDGDYTVFAPTNDAFKKISRDDMEALIVEHGQVTLKAILSYHILPGIFTAYNLRDLASTTTITGAEVTLTNSDRLRVNGSTVKARNIQASDGILHAVDTVLAPPLSH